MNTPIKRVKSTALGKKCTPSRGPTKHRKELSGTEKDVDVCVCVCACVRACVRVCVCFVFNFSVIPNQF